MAHIRIAQGGYSDVRQSIAFFVIRKSLESMRERLIRRCFGQLSGQCGRRYTGLSSHYLPVSNLCNHKTSETSTSSMIEYNMKARSKASQYLTFKSKGYNS